MVFWGMLLDIYVLALLGLCSAIHVPLDRTAMVYSSHAMAVQSTEEERQYASEVLQQSECLKHAPIEPQSQHYRILPEAHPSGKGNIDDYYHFLIDWSAPMLYFLRSAGPNITIHAPCFASGGNAKGRTFRFTDGYSTKATWDRMFAYRNQVVTIVREVYPPWRLAPLNDWKLQKNRQEWSLMDKSIYTYFRDFWWDVVKPKFPRDGGGITIVVRGQSLLKRKDEASAFRGNLSLAMPVLESSGVRFQIVDFANMTQEEQVRVVADSVVVMGVHGAGLSNTVFLRHGSLVIEMGPQLFPCYRNLAERMSFEYHHFDDMTLVKHALVAFAIPKARLILDAHHMT